MSPVRIQRRRTRGWRAQDHTANRLGVIYVGRPTTYANHWAVVQTPTGWAASWTAGSFGQDQPWHPTAERRFITAPTETAARRTAVDLYRAYIDAWPELSASARLSLRGRDLMCWCPLGEPCHADVLLELANEPGPA
ncbi:DUF4326 domain-containing protein [Streptomyces acidiscabies]|uniref:DUF4326 domain-containing protein n=1 Tax=Streptomyces acidiscabies TaxID=42234 RepID=UPI00073F5363|nr:DUF4326 domain-containing protein [Streptomyces acidiscabies]GAQ52103.1 hypothetical protein a10_01884 [Streptomyces acidiscabies]